MAMSFAATVWADGIGEDPLDSPSEQVSITTAFCNDLITQISVRRCAADNFALASAYSVEGRPLLVKDYQAVDHAIAPLGRVMVIGGTHGDEPSSVQLVFDWMTRLDQQHQGTFVWRFIPALNPDGLLADRPTRTNANGVDLNRNMSVSGNARAPYQYWERRGKPERRFPGDTPLSEPETQWLVQQIVQFKPDVIISVHAPLGMVDFDGSHQIMSPPKRFGHLHLRDLAAYPGSLGNYAGVQRGIPVVTLELHSSNRLPREQQNEQMWFDMVRWLMQSLGSR